jgi:hypothetical protein
MIIPQRRKEARKEDQQQVFGRRSNCGLFLHACVLLTAIHRRESSLHTCMWCAVQSACLLVNILFLIHVANGCVFLLSSHSLLLLLLPLGGLSPPFFFTTHSSSHLQNPEREGQREAKTESFSPGEQRL